MHMNIKKDLHFSDAKPAVLAVRRSARRNVTAIGLKKNQVLKEHKTSFETTMIVLQGKLHFVIGEEIWELQAMDVFEVPCDIYHKVVAKEESIFVLIQEK